MPNYMTIIDTQDSEENWRGVFMEFERDYPWASKERKVAWRGALSEAEWRNALSSVRWRVAELVHNSKSDLFDIGLTSIPSWVTEHVTFDLSKIGGFKAGIAPMKAFQKYMAILDMDGNSWSRWVDFFRFCLPHANVNVQQSVRHPIVLQFGGFEGRGEVLRLFLLGSEAMVRELTI
jgi:hypothetical protein